MATPDVQQVPSHMRTVPGSFNIPVARFPSVAKNEPINADRIASTVVDAFNKSLDQQDFQSIGGLFVDNGFWRDHLALSWKLRTVQGSKGIVEFLQSCSESRDGLRLKKIALDTSSAVRAPQVCTIDGTGSVPGVQFFFTVETKLGSGMGVARLVSENGIWKIFTLYTGLRSLNGHEEATYHRRPKGAEHGGRPDRKNWAEKRADDAAYENDKEPTVLIIGAGQGGLSAAARLKMLGVDALIIDKANLIGDNWRLRYRQLVLHDPVWYDHMPYLNFPAHWPIFTPKDKLAEFFECYAKILELNVWMKTTITRSEWNDQEGNWTVSLSTRQDDGTYVERTFHPRHIIQATGHSGKMNMPCIPGMENFKGDLLCHSSQFPGAAKNKRGKKAVVVGSCNSAHDIAQDYQEKGYDITIVQRSTTCVITSKAITEIGLKGFYEEDGPPVDDADILLHGTPMPVLKALQVHVTKQQADHDKELLDGLARAGFKVDRGPDGAGLFMKYFQRGGGYYIDVGASKMIADGRIKVKQGQEIAEILSDGIRFADGSLLQADEIIFATGYENMRSQTRLILGDEVADKVSDIWGFNEEGEMRTIWQQSGHPGFWFHGGNLATARYYSRVLALQIKALEAGLYRYGEK
ncbi:flavin-containing monooxygenase [Aspergillus rambellii]|uniref:Flavin-containing monooxygenase n=1 Tax=Aspergillus rambellii TaxID=308745 RepID=A0A0F8XEH6_9EURO|nr:flavin-containing monooxygenase [Aspergillus rambellii]